MGADVGETQSGREEGRGGKGGGQGEGRGGESKGWRRGEGVRVGGVGGVGEEAFNISKQKQNMMGRRPSLHLQVYKVLYFAHV